MKTLLKDFVTGGRPWNPADAALRQVMAVNIFTAFGIAVLAILSVVHYHFDAAGMALVVGTVAVVGALNLLWLRWSSNGEVASSVTLCCLATVLFASILDGGIEASGPYWLGIFPAVAFFFKGKRRGLLWTAGMLLFLMVLIGTQLLGFQPTPFSTLALILLLAAVTTFSTLVYAYEFLRSSADERLKVQSTELIGINARLIAEARDRKAAEAALRRSDAELRYLAHHDRLTDLPNRHFLTERLTALIEESVRNGGQGAVMFVDLDGFKAINDQLGHVVGDELLRFAAKRLRHLLRGSDFAARYGGDEFVIVFPDLAERDALKHAATRLIQAMSTPFEIKGHPCCIGVSIGIAVFPEHGSDFDTVMNHADAAMYQAKTEGGNRWAFYSVEQTQHRADRIVQR